MLTIALLIVTTAVEWTEPQEVRLRRDVVATYRAAIAGDTLIIEVDHAEGWHTYAMDNVERAREASGDDTPECELPTRIEVSGGLNVAGDWRQSEPIDLSNKEIKWYTFGFEGTSYFAVDIERTSDEEATVKINAQACNASKCAMVDGLELRVPVNGGAGETEVDIEALVPVEIEPDKKGL